MKFELAAFTRDPRLVAQLAGAEEVFSFLARTLTLPPGCAAMVWPGAGPARVYSPGMAVEGDDAARLLFVRTSSFSLEYAIGRLTSGDGYAFDARVLCGVQAVIERSELAAFCDRVLGSASSVTLDRLRQHCEEVVHAAAEAFVRARSAQDLLTPRCWADFDAVLVEHFKPLGFASGLNLGEDARITLESTDYARAAEARRTHELREQRVAEESRLRELASAARQRHLSELAATLDKLRDMASKSEASLPKLIRALDPAQRGGLYHALLTERKGRDAAMHVLIVAGDELIWIDPAGPARLVRRVSLSSQIGPLRSVRAARWEGRTVLLVGARSGVHLLQTEQDPRQSFAFPADRELRGGVNAACIVGEHVYATHSEVGLVRWRLRRSDAPEHLCVDTLTGAKSVRDVQPDDAGRIWFSADRRVLRVTPGDASKTGVDTGPPPIPPEVSGRRSPVEPKPEMLEAPAEVTTLTVADGRPWAGLENGQIVTWAAGETLRESIRPATGQPVESIGLLEGGGVPRLLVADRRPYVDMMVLGDVSSTKYTTNQPIRWALPAGDWIVGVNDRRDQLVIWRIEDPAEPAAVVSIGRLCGHSVQDIATTSEIG